MTGTEEKSLLEKISRLDRRVMFWVMFILIAFPYVRPFAIPMEISTYTRDFYDTVETFSSDDVVLVSLDCGLGAVGELGGGVVALARHLSRNNVKVVAVAAVDQGPMLFEQYFQPVLEDAGYKYGIDYVNLGFAAGQETMIARIGEDIKTVFSNDYYGTKVEELILLNDITGAKDFTAVFTFDTGSTSAFYSRQWNAKYGTLVLSIPSAGNFQAIMPLIESRSIKAALNGPKGSAEYEQLLNAPGMANKSITALSMGHLTIIFFMLIGNTVYTIERFRGGK